MPSAYLNNPSRVLPITVTPDAPDRDVVLLKLVGAIVPGWAGCRRAGIMVVPGGITNQLFRLSATDRPTVLVRVYGRNTEVVIDREAENQLFARLSQEGFAPTYYGRFENGRVEGWWSGFRPLEPHEMGDPHIRRLIAAKLHEMHGIAPLEPAPMMWATLNRWMDAALKLTFDGPDAERYAALELPRYAEVMAALERSFHERPLTGPGEALADRSVLAHNDLLSGNILYDDANEVRFIDYEYGACAPAGFDIANHFCEYAGFDSDYERGFPGRDVRDDFIAAYLGRETTAEVVSGFSRAVDRFILCDHFWWGIWAVIQAKYSTIDFDYLEYARLRLAGFDYHEETLG